MEGKKKHPLTSPSEHIQVLMNRPWAPSLPKGQLIYNVSANHAVNMVVIINLFLMFNDQLPEFSPRQTGIWLRVRTKDSFPHPGCSERCDERRPFSM